MIVAYQGEKGAFSEEAVKAFFGPVRTEPKVSFEAVFEAVTTGTVDYAMIPIENSLFGSVYVNYDLLRIHDLAIVGELRLRVRHNLLGLPGTRMEHIRKVYSHPQALGQCQSFINERLSYAEVVPAYDTAGAAKMVRETGDRSMAAIASEQAAAVYGLEILAAGIESNSQNYTRFLALARGGESNEFKQTREEESPLKTSIVYAMQENVPGALFKSLAVFALRDLDLYKIESRPLIGSPGNYLFYLDLQGATWEEVVQRALDHLREIAAFVKVLGSYPVGKIVE